MKYKKILITEYQVINILMGTKYLMYRSLAVVQHCKNHTLLSTYFVIIFFSLIFFRWEGGWGWGGGEERTGNPVCNYDLQSADDYFRRDYLL